MVGLLNWDNWGGRGSGRHKKNAPGSGKTYNVFAAYRSAGAARKGLFYYNVGRPVGS